MVDRENPFKKDRKNSKYLQDVTILLKGFAAGGLEARKANEKLGGVRTQPNSDTTIATLNEHLPETADVDRFARNILELASDAEAVKVLTIMINDMAHGKYGVEPLTDYRVKVVLIRIVEAILYSRDLSMEKYIK